MFICLDIASLTISASDKEFCRESLHPVSAEQAWSSAMDLLLTLSRYFLPRPFHHHIDNKNHDNVSFWRQRFMDVMHQIDQCDPANTHALEAAAQKYASLREHWNSYILAFCHSQVYSFEEIAPHEILEKE